MCHTSPSTFLLWGLLSCTLCVFLVSHLYSFDRFRCLKWNSSPGSGAFKRVMTYSYLLSVPLLVVYSVGFAVIKYDEGWVPLVGVGIIPKPYQIWTPMHQRMIFPLQVFLSVAWGLEIVSHLEELCFWLFLLGSSKSGKQVSWFKSIYFRLWCLGSLLGAVGIPLVTIVNRADPLKAEAWTFLIASSGSLALTLLFLPVLWSFPTFLDRLKADGTQRRVVLRLCQFHDFNIMRVVFRFIFVLPFLVLGIDGVQAKHVINESIFWTDILAMSGAIGCIISSVLTLLIFFPRSLEAEAGYVKSSRQASTHYGDAPPQEKARRASGASEKLRLQRLSSVAAASPVDDDPDAFGAGPTYRSHGTLFKLYQAANIEAHDALPTLASQEALLPGAPPAAPTRPPRPAWADADLDARRAGLYPPRAAGGPQRLHPMIRNYRSPIDLIDSYYSTAGGEYV